MKALITAGGRATRLRPITQTINKHLIPLGNRPMVVYAIEKLVEAGVTDIAINVNPGENDIQRVCGDGSRWGAKLTFIEQLGGPKGLAHIIKNARPFLKDDPFIFYLGDNIILGSLRRFIEKFQKEKLNCLLALAKVRDPQRFGVPEIVDGRIVRVVEKPAKPMSNYAVTGIYVYDRTVHEAVEAVQPSARGEYEISDVNTWLIEHGRAVGYDEITGWWKDTGKPEDLIEGNHLILDQMSEAEAVIEGTVEEGVTLVGRIRIGRGTRIGPGSVIRGPVAIGENCVIEDSFIGPFTAVGNRVEMYRAEVEHSVIFDDVDISTGERIVDSLIGQNASIISERESKPTGHRLVIGDNSVVEL